MKTPQETLDLIEAVQEGIHAGRDLDDEGHARQNAEEFFRRCGLDPEVLSAHALAVANSVADNVDWDDDDQRDEMIDEAFGVYMSAFQLGWTIRDAEALNERLAG